MAENHTPKSNENNLIKERKIGKIISGTAKTKKKNELRKLTDTFISEDMASVKSYIWSEVLIPTIKKTINDIVTNGIEMLLWGSSAIKKKSSNSSKVQYRAYYDKPGDHRDRYYTQTRTGYSYDDIILDSRSEAEEVLSKMDEIISVYGLISIADLYDLVGLVGNHTDNKYGWTDIRSASVVRVSDGYLLKLPKALPLD